MDDYLSKWENQLISMSNANGPIVFPLEFSSLIRYDIYQTDAPSSQIIVKNSEESRSIREKSEWYYIRSIFCPEQSSGITRELFIESAEPPRRTRLRPSDKSNKRDLSEWVVKAHMNSLLTHIKGSFEYFIDYADSPDRYLISIDNTGSIPGWRRLWRFIGFPVTQYYISKSIYHGQESCMITSGPYLTLHKHRKIIGSFYGFDYPLASNNRYAIYTRQDPFPRMLVSTDTSAKTTEGWVETEVFYAFDVSILGTCRYFVKNRVPDLRSHTDFISRHKLTTVRLEQQWDALLELHVYPATIQDCSFRIES